MKNVIPLILLSVVLVAGCTTGGESRPTVVVNNGIVINEFSVDPDVIDSSIGETATLFLEIENVGGTTAKNVKAILSGVSGLQVTNPEKDVGTLSPPDITVQPPTPGEFEVLQWTLNPVQLPEGIKHPYQVSVRVEYDYITTGVITIPLYMKEEYKRRMQRGEPVKTTLTVTNTNAPVKIDMTGETPFVARSTGDVGSYRLIFRNVGDGVPSTNGVDGLILGKVRIVGGNAEFEDCLGETSGTEIILDPTDPVKQIKLRRGESDKRLCNIKYTGSAQTDTITIEFELTYRYYIQSEVTVVVIGGLSETL